MRILSLFIVLIISITSNVFAQNVGIGTATPHASAKLHIEDANRGLLLPKVFLSAVNNATTPVNAPAIGLLVYNTNVSVTGGAGVGFYFWNGTQWEKMASGAIGDHDWYEVGTTTAPDNINDNIYTFGNVGIGKNNPTYRLDVSGGSSSLDKYVIIKDFNTANEHVRAISRDSSLMLWQGGLVVGQYALGALPLGFNANGTLLSKGQSAFAVTSGNVGIGNTTPEVKLDARGFPIQWGNRSMLGTGQGGSIELGGSSAIAGVGTPYIDFHFNGLVQDYNTRIINSADGQLSFLTPTRALFSNGVRMAGLPASAVNTTVLTRNAAGDLETRVLPADIWDGDANTTYTAGTGLTLTGTTFSNNLGNSIESGEITDGTIVAADLNQMGATTNQVLTWNGTNWTPAAAASDHDWYEVGTTAAPDNINDNIYTFGNVGIGTNAPLYRLDLGNGTFAFGNSNTRTETRDNAGLQGNAGAQSGFFESVNPINYPAGASSWWHLIDVRHSNNGNNYAMQISGSFFDQELWFRKTNGVANTPWNRFLSATSGWTTIGNTGTNPATNFIGTTDAVDFVTRTANVERMRIVGSTGNIGIGNTTPEVKLDLRGFDLQWGNRSMLSSNQGGSMELGAGNGQAGTGTPFIDFHYNGLTQDYNTRIINDANGQLSFIALRSLFSNSVRMAGLPASAVNTTVLTRNAAGDLETRVLPADIWDGDANTIYTAGTGLTLTGTTFSNAAPDQVVTVLGAGSTTVTGTYPNFTVSSTDANTTYTAGAGLTLTGTTFSNNLGNSIESGEITDGTIVAADLNQMGAAANQVLTWNGTNWTPAAAASDHDWYEVGTTTAPDNINDNVYTFGKMGLGINNPVASLHLVGNDGFLATGTFGSGLIPATGVGRRMMWYSRKAAFRVGGVNGTRWDDANIGDYSVAMGWENLASGTYSVALGVNNQTNGTGNAISGGSGNTIASAAYSSNIGGGSGNTVSMHLSVVAGGSSNNISTGHTSAIGGGAGNSIAGNYGIVAGGQNNGITTTGTYNSVGGGYNNDITSGASNTIGGGYNNLISITNGNAVYGWSTISGGYSNQIVGNTAEYSSIVGGRQNSITSNYGIIGGGYQHQLSGIYSGIFSGNGNTVSSNFAAILGGSANSITGASSAIGSGTSNTIQGGRAFLGAGQLNTITGLGEQGFLGAGNNNTLNMRYSVIAGGMNNEISGSNTVGTVDSLAFIGAGRNNLSYFSNASFIGSGISNEVNNSDYAAIVGGWNNTINNNSRYAYIGGGIDNTVSGQFSVVNGGSTNTVLSHFSVISGGSESLAQGNWSTVSGGQSNFATGAYSTIAGGQSNGASGQYSFVGAGRNNAASGNSSVALGSYANTNGMAGSFVYSDNSSATNTMATVANQFKVRAAGGTIFYSNSAMSTGVQLAAGGGAWATVSDRNKKENFEDINNETVLAKIAKMPVTTWNYISQTDSIRHIGPMAQDFYAAFGLGESDTTITTTDMDGVNMAAIQALEKRTQDLKSENEALKARLDSQAKELAEIKAMLSQQNTGLHAKH